MTTTITASRKPKAFIKKLVFKICAGGLPDQLFCEYLDNVQFALKEAFEFSEEFDVKIEPDQSLIAFKPDYMGSDKAFPTGRPWELKAWSTRAAQDLELTAKAAKVVMPDYLALLDQQEKVANWLPGFDFHEDQVVLHWIEMQGHRCSESEADWILSQAGVFGVDATGYSIQTVAGLVHERRTALATTWVAGQDSQLDCWVLSTLASLSQQNPAPHLVAEVRRIAKVALPAYADAAIPFLAEQLLPLPALQVAGEWLFAFEAERDGKAVRSLSDLLAEAEADIAACRDYPATLAALGLPAVPGADMGLDRKLLQCFASGSLPCFLPEQRTWLTAQAEVHAPHCAHAHWSTSQRVAQAVLERWNKIERRFAAYTQHDHANPIPA